LHDAKVARHPDTASLLRSLNADSRCSFRLVDRPVSLTPRSNLALENAHRSGGAARYPLVSVAAIGDYLAEGAITVNARRIVTYANRIATALLGLRIESLLGRDVLTIASPSQSDAPSQFARALAEVMERGVEQVLTVNDLDTASAFNVDYCRLVPIADGGALILLGETMSPSVSEQLTQARALAEILQRINQSLEVERVVQLLASHSAELLGGDSARVLLYEGDYFQTASGVGTGARAIGQRHAVDETFAGEAIRAGGSARTEDLGATPQWRDIEITGDGRDRGRVGAVAASLQIGGRPIGAVMVTGRPEYHFSEHHEQLLITLATHGAIALENAKLYRAAAQTARHAGILAATARTLAFNVSAEALYAGLTGLVTESLRADGFSIHAADAAYGQVTLLYTHGIGTAAPNAGGHTFWDTPAGAVTRSGNSAFTTGAPVAGGSAASSETGATAILPLIIEGRPRGVLTLRFRQPRDFDDRERALLVDFSTAVAVAMRNASLVGDLERRATRLSAVAKVQLAMSRTELHDVYAEIYRAVASSVSNATCFALLLADDAAALFRPQLIVVDGIVTWSPALSAVPLTECAASMALRTGQTVVSNQPLRSWGTLVLGSTAATVSQLMSEIAVPMVHGDRTLGVLIVQSQQRGAFTDEDVELLSIIARQAGVAIENARLFAAQRGEREMAEAAARVARIALSTPTTADAAAAILEVVGDVVSLAGAAIGLLHQNDAIMYVGATGSARTALGKRIPLAASIARDVVPRDEHETDAPATERADVVGPLHDADLSRGGVVLPLAAKSRLLGVLTAAARPGSTLPAASVDALRRLAPSIALAIDVQLLGEGERHRHERERMLATALATMDQPVFVLSLDRHVLYANDAAVREYGYTLDELTTMSVDVFVASAVPIRATDDLSRTPANVVIAEHVHRRRDGSQFPATVALSFIRQDNGAPIGQVLSVRNLTDERRIAEQLRQSEKLAALGELVAGVAHELNNPLAGISAFAQLLLEEELNADQRESARLIKREADRAVGVIRDLLLFSRKAGPSIGPVDLNGLVQLTLRLRAYSLRSSGVEVDTRLDMSLPELSGDDQKLQQVILNLIVNAEYAMRRSTTKRLVIRTALEGDTVVTEISDTGTGMSEETLQRVFEPFFTTKPAGDGTGLGLSVSYGIVEAHGGVITVESAPGQGTSFRIVLPVPHARAESQGRTA
jgi:PAS domain S-box-containing protein